MMKVYRTDPLSDPRWAEIVERHPRASVFHTVAWLRAIRETYDYAPMVFTTSPPTGDLKNGLVFCSINSWLTGHRLVSLPFSDHCEPLCDSVEEVNVLISYLRMALEYENWRYVEIRPVSGPFDQAGDRIGFRPAARYFLHKLDLRPDLDEVFRRLDKDCVQRRIQRARRASLVEKCGRSDDLLKEFYALFVTTRGRHHLPPIPYAWFQNLTQCQGKTLEIRVAYKDRTPIAAILTLRFRDVVYYKYGCSDARFNNFGATPWLLWRAIAAGKADGATEFDMGRTQEENEGLLAFKNHWVRQSKPLVYKNFPGTSTLDFAQGWKLKVAQGVFSCLPEKLLAMSGRLLYRHIG